MKNILLNNQKFSPAIYKIENIVNNKVYIGQSIRPYRRFTYHKRELIKGIHGNFYLQNDYKIFDNNSFIFSIIEQCKKEELNNKENYWLNYYNVGNKNLCYNIATKAEIENNKIRAKSYNFLSPDNIVYSGHNISEFALSKNLDEKCLQALQRGSLKTYHEWISLDIDYKYNKIILISPENIEYTNMDFKNNFNEFARNHNISTRQINYLINKTIKTYKGWRLKENSHLTGKSYYEENEIYIKNINTEKIYGPIKDVKSFMITNNIKEYSSFYKMLKGQRKTTQKFKLSSKEEFLKAKEV